MRTLVLEEIARENKPKYETLLRKPVDEREAPKYRGLTFLEEKAFDGGTSIKYWM